MTLCGAGIAALGLCVAQAQNVPEHHANAVPYATRSNPETLVLDASTAARGFVTSTMEIPVTPGQFTFVYPEWIPGDHGPTGPLADISELEVSAKGRPLTWRRDGLDMYAFHVNVPADIAELQVRFTVLLNSPDAMSTPKLALVNWNRVLFYQDGTDYHNVYFKASIILPDGWGYGTALPVARQMAQRIDFGEVSLSVLGDSPLDCGRYYQHVLLWQQGDARQWLDMFADEPEDLDVSRDVLDEYKRLAPEALAMYGSRHWREYHSLLTLSDKIESDGIEHHQSSDDRMPADFMTDPQWQLVAGDLLAHEFSHSWNGKYRRPWDLYTRNYQIPQRTDLLWVYEGMNKYLGDLLSFRAGIRKPNDYHEYLAMLYSAMASEPGRDTEPLIDTTTAAPYLYQAQGQYPSIRRTTEDFYIEGELLWLDVDTLIRTLTHGEKSLDDFLHRYSGPALTATTAVRTYTRADIEHLLSEVAPYDWHAFFQRHVYEVAKLPPTAEIERAGWRLVYSDQPNEFLHATEARFHTNEQWLTYGFNVDKGGQLLDVREASPAWQAAMAPGMTIEAVDGQAYSPDLLRYLMRQAQKTKQQTTFLVSQDGWFRTIEVSYFGGARFPHLERIPGKPDLLAQIMAPHVKP